VLPRLSLTRWFTLLVLAAVLPLLLFGGLTLAWLTQSYRATADQGQADTTRARALAIDAELRAWKAALLALAESNELRAGRLQDFHAEAIHIAGRYHGWIGLTDRTGHQVANTARAYGEALPRTGVPGTVATVFREGTPAVSDVRPGIMAPLSLITVAVPVVQDNAVRYALHLSVESETLAGILGAHPLSPRWVAALIDSQGHLIARWPARNDGTTPPMPARLQAAVTGQKEGFVESDAFGGGPARLAFARLDEAPWAVAVAVPLTELAAAWERPLIGFVLVGTLLGLVAIGLAVAVSRRIARPIHTLARDSARMLRGDPVPPSRPSRIEEVHRLQETLAGGAEQAQAYYRERERSARAEEAARVAASAEAAVRQSEADLNRAQAVARTGSWRLHGPAGELWWSYETYRMFGIPPGTPLTYEAFLAHVHPEDRDNVDRQWQAALRGASYDIEHRIVVRGEVKWVRERGELECDDEGQLQGGFGTVQDITEQKAAEAERRSLALFPEQDPAPVLRIAHDGMVLYANAAGQPLLAAWGCPMGNRLDPRSPLREVWTAGQTIEHEVTCEGRAYSLVCVPFEAEGYVNIYGRDITPRKRAEQALADSQHLLHSILEQAPDGMNVRDRQGCVMFANRVSRRRALRPPEGTPLKMAPEVWGEFLDADGTPVPVEEWPAARALRGETVTKEFLRRTPTGTFYVLNSGAPLRNDKGEIIGAVNTTTDISEQKALEDRLRVALAEKEAALATNLALLREVHHRVKNNLQMLCDMMYLQMEAMPDRDQHQDLQDAYGRIYAIARLHEHLYQSMRSGQVALRDYLGQLARGFEDLYPTTVIRIDVPPDLVYLDMDSAIHAGLIANELVTNAAKHAFPKGQPGEVFVRLQVVGGDLELEVRDRGRGLPADLDVMQVKSLGLRMVHILATGLGGTVAVANAGGVAVTVRLPIKGKSV
jgi:two-component sensor histidine kinase